jgi:hypothetical protein
VFPIESGGEVPGVFLVEGIADDNLPRSIGSTLLEVVTIRDSIVIVADTTGLLRAVRDFAMDGEGASVESFYDHLFVLRSLREDPSWINEAKKKGNESYKKDRYNSF